VLSRYSLRRAYFAAHQTRSMRGNDTCCEQRRMARGCANTMDKADL
jgi:hypothetical protein